jgi:hypothetical protein
VRITNTTASGETVKVGIGGTADVNLIFADYPVPANDSVEWRGSLPLEAAETLNALASTTDVLIFVASGVLVTA